VTIVRLADGVVGSSIVVAVVMSSAVGLGASMQPSKFVCANVYPHVRSLLASGISGPSSC